MHRFMHTVLVTQKTSLIVLEFENDVIIMYWKNDQWYSCPNLYSLYLHSTVALVSLLPVLWVLFLKQT